MPPGNWVNKMFTLPVPSKTLAAKINSPLSWEERIEAMELDPYSGSAEVNLYSFQELIAFLDVDTRCLTEMRGFMRFIEPEELCNWTRRTLGDQDLAEAIETIVKKEVNSTDPVENYSQKLASINSIKELLSFRLAQCRQVLEGNGKVQEEIA